MTASFDHFGPSDRSELDESARTVLHIDPDERRRSTVAAAVARQDTTVDIVAVKSAERARSVLADLRFDCVVVGDIGTTAVLDSVDAPVVLHTDEDPANVDASVRSAADTVIERRGDDRPEFLARKVLSLTATDADRGRTGYALERALSRAEAADDGGSYQFLVDDTGRVVWASAPFDRVFPVDRLETPLPATENFDEKLGALLADSPSAIPTVSRTRRGVDATQRESVTVRTGDGEAHFVHTGYRLPEALDSLRLEVFERVTPEVEREGRAELLELLVAASKDGLYTLDRHGNIEFCNRSFAEMLGYEPDDLIGRHAATVLVEGELERGQARIAELLDDESRESATVDLTFRRRNGELLEMAIHFTLLPSETGSYAGLMGVARDITERKERERTLETYRQLVEAARDPMFVLDADGRITLFNEALASVVAEESLEGNALTGLFSQQDRERVAGVLAELRSGERDWAQSELRLTDGTGTERLYEATVGALRDDESFAGTVGTLRDITERDRRTRELDLLKQVLTRVLRHNVRSKFTVIHSYADRLIDGSADPAVAGEAIRETSESLLATSEKARAIERLVEKDADQTTQDLSVVAEVAVNDVATRYPDATYEVDVPSVLVRSHPSLEIAVENAVENAVVHTEDPVVRLDAAVTEDTVELRIADNGPGIPETDLVSIQRREETPLQHTSGAGLWLIDWVVFRSDGTLAFDTDGGGTTVRIELDRGDADNIS